MTEEEQSSQTCQQLRNQRPESVQRPSKLPRIDGIESADGGEEEAEEERELIERNMSPNPRIQRYLIAVEYIGTRFSGAQKQSTCRTVVGVLEDAFQKFIGQPVPVFCSSRTDAGVHALSNVCHVDVERISKRKPGEVLLPHEPAVVKRAVNHFLQKNEGDIMVIDVKCVPSDFHARYKALERTYFYRLLTGKEPLSTFEKDQAWHVPEELSLLAMQKACEVLVGRHDFSSFRAAACQAKSPIRTLDELTITEVASSPYFPSMLEREQSNYASASSVSISKKLQNDSPSLAGISDELTENSGAVAVQGFGVRKRHRCFVVTTRARSFLYHQEGSAIINSSGSDDATGWPPTATFNCDTWKAGAPEPSQEGAYSFKAHMTVAVLLEGRIVWLGGKPMRNLKDELAINSSRICHFRRVRLLVGVLKSVGTGDITHSDVKKILEAKNISAAPPMAPACGLYLGHVNYDLPSDA